MAIALNGIDGNSRSFIRRQETDNGVITAGQRIQVGEHGKSATRFLSKSDEEGNRVADVRPLPREVEVEDGDPAVQSHIISRTDEEGNQITRIVRSVVNEDGEKSRSVLQVKETDEGTIIRAFSQATDGDSRSAQRAAIKIDDEGNVVARLTGKNVSQDPETGEVEKAFHTTTIQTTVDQIEEGSQLDKILDLVA